MERAVASGLKWTALQSWGVQASSFVVFLVLARLLAPEAFGLVAMAQVFVVTVRGAIDQGMVVTLVQRDGLEDDHLHSAFWATTLAGVLLLIIGVSFAGLIANAYNEPALASIVSWLSLGFVTAGLVSVPEALLTRTRQFKLLAVRRLAATLVGGVVGIICAARGMGAHALVAQELVTSSVSVLVLWATTHFRPRFRFSWHHYKELLPFSANVLGVRILYQVGRRSDDLIIGYVLGPVVLGFYTVAYKIFKVVLDMFTRIISRVALPTLANVQKDKVAFADQFYTFLKISALIAFPIFAAVGVLANEVVLTFFGAKWIQSAPIMRILSVAGLLQALVLIAHQGFYASGRPEWTFRYFLVSTALLVSAFILAAPHGIAAVAMALLAVELVTAPTYFFVLHKKVGIPLAGIVRSLVGPAIAALTLAVATSLFIALDRSLDARFALFIATMLGVVTYTCVIYAIDPRVRSMVGSVVGTRFSQSRRVL